MIRIVSSLPADSVLFDRELRPNGRTIAFIDLPTGRTTLYLQEEAMKKSVKKGLDASDKKELKQMGKKAFIAQEKKDISIAKKGKK